MVRIKRQLRLGRGRWLELRRSGIIIGAFVITLALVMAPGANATTASVAGCTDNAILRFTPALKNMAVAGTVNESTTRTCTTATVNTSPLGESIQASTSTWSGSYPYFGNCELALFSIADGEGILLGGAVNVNVHGLAKAVKVLVLTPNKVCDESSASGRGVVALR